MFQNKDIQLNLKGFSGNRIEVIRTKEQTFVRKTAKNQQEHDKMQNEITKLETLLEISKNSNLFKIPKVLKTGINNEKLFFYDLEFIPAESLDSRLQKFSSERIKKIAVEISNIINEISKSPDENLQKISEENFLKEKLQETFKKIIQTKTKSKLLKEILDEYNNIICNLEIDLQHLTNNNTFCHGDLALDNILITRNNEIYLIDPLKNDFENKMWDFAKVLQSSMTHWNLIKYNNFEFYENRIKIKPHEHMSLFHKHFVENIKNFESGTIILYLAVTLARVAKYSKNEKQLCALILITNNLLSDYNDRRYDLNGSLSSLRW